VTFDVNALVEQYAADQASAAVAPVQADLDTARLQLEAVQTELAAAQAQAATDAATIAERHDR
jgi:hypothetical protein